MGLPGGINPYELIQMVMGIGGVAKAQQENEAAMGNTRGRYEQGLWMMDQNRDNAYRGIMGDEFGLNPNTNRYNPVFLNQYANMGQNSWGGSGNSGTPIELIEQSGAPGAANTVQDMRAAGQNTYPGPIAPQGQTPGQTGPTAFINNLLNSFGFGMGQKPGSGSATQAGNYDQQMRGGQSTAAPAASNAWTSQPAVQGDPSGQGRTVRASSTRQADGPPQPPRAGTTMNVGPQSAWKTAASPGQPSSQPANTNGNGQFSLLQGAGGSPALYTGYRNDSNNLISGYNDRASSVMDMINAKSNQDAKDLQTSFNNQGNQQQAQLANRGLGNSTVGASLAQGNTAAASAAMNRLNDTNTNTKANWMSDLMGDTLQAKGQQMQGLDAIRKLNFMTDQDTLQRALNWIGDRTDAAPGADAFNSLQAGLTGISQNVRTSKAAKQSAEATEKAGMWGGIGGGVSGALSGAGSAYGGYLSK